jgi:CheY-like chemotaxis protein
MKLSHGRIMVVDDDLDIQEVLEMALTASDYEVTCAKNCLDALNALKLGNQAEWPNLIILDEMMPVMNGQEFLAARTKAGIAKIPVLFCSGNRIAQTEALTASGVLVIGKPLDLDTLLTNIAAHASKSA